MPQIRLQVAAKSGDHSRIGAVILCPAQLAFDIAFDTRWIDDADIMSLLMQIARECVSIDVGRFLGTQAPALPAAP